VTTIICGVDVSSRTLDARAGPDGPAARFPNSPEGVGALAALRRERGVGLVAMEATGGYERLPFALLRAAGVPAALVNPRQSLPRTRSGVRRFAEAVGILERTDRIDAGVVARFAEVGRVAARPPADPTRRKLAALVTRPRQLTGLRTARRNQRRLVDGPLVLASVDEVLALVGRQVRELEAEVAALVGGDPVWAALDAAFRAVEGVADRTVARLLAGMPEIGTLPGKAAAKLAGLAPIARDSGRAGGRRPVRGGRAGVRSALVVVAGVVRRHDPDFAACHARLVAAGKPRMVIRVALARELLVRLNAKARDARRALAAQGA
jgi:transposase